jgi:SHS2 domain-containing protein
MGEAPSRWRTTEHTADLAIEVEARSLDELFFTSAQGMMGALLGLEEGPVESGADHAAVWRRLSLDASDREALLVDWLRELLYVQISEDLFFAGAEIERLDETGMVARVAFRPLPKDHFVQRELKGITYHDLEVTRRVEGWFARIVFDL